jgi:hypothetical protein
VRFAQTTLNNDTAVSYLGGNPIALMLAMVGLNQRVGFSSFEF